MPRPNLNEYVCAAHVHSTHSDGTGTVRQIARAARRAGVDVVLLTDHDTLAARAAGEERHYGDVLVLVGEEVSPEGGNHYLAFGNRGVIDHDGLSPAAICEAVAADGGFGFAAHPFSRGSDRFKRARPMPWGDLETEHLQGIELWSFVNDNGEQIGSLRDAARFLRRPGAFVDLAPRRNLEQWDEMCRTRRVAALGGIDAHQIGLRMLGVVPLRLMSYRRSFSHLRTHVLCEQRLNGDLDHDRAQVFDALREGRAFLAMDSLQRADGFDFWAEHGRATALAMGSDGPAAPGWELQVRLPRSARLRLVHAGKTIVETDGTGLHHHAEAPGAYRVEVLLGQGERERTWILSNPIYLR